jgi:hypothetical protein
MAKPRLTRASTGVAYREDPNRPGRVIADPVAAHYRLGVVEPERGGSVIGQGIREALGDDAYTDEQQKGMDKFEKDATRRARQERQEFVDRVKAQRKQKREERDDRIADEQAVEEDF